MDANTSDTNTTPRPTRELTKCERFEYLIQTMPQETLDKIWRVAFREMNRSMLERGLRK